MFVRYFIKLCYFGKNYHGWQIQPHSISVQEKLQTAISTILRTSVEIVGAGRTDAGVHAMKMYAHFDFNDKLADNFTYKLNAILPNDIVIYDVLLVNNNAHARFDAVNRSYEYKIFLGRNPFLLDTTWQITNKEIDVNLMNEACKMLYKYNDFECFSKVKTDVYTFNCTITNAEWILKGNELTFYISANRFLRNMVRAIVGTLLDVGLKKTSLQEFKNIIESKDRCMAGVSVPAKGLFLTNVEYPYL
ncbi:MAG: tRNA pseudouridine(38-40) synthase TruA [Tenacibaculum sp.]|nr:tRNA pseudouridine(38-40) synthase TruA [Tenacibaculum sp.]